MNVRRDGTKKPVYSVDLCAGPSARYLTFAADGKLLRAHEPIDVAALPPAVARVAKVAKMGYGGDGSIWSAARIVPNDDEKRATYRIMLGKGIGMCWTVTVTPRGKMSDWGMQTDCFPYSRLHPD